MFFDWVGSAREGFEPWSVSRWKLLTTFFPIDLSFLTFETLVLSCHFVRESWPFLLDVSVLLCEKNVRSAEVQLIRKKRKINLPALARLLCFHSFSPTLRFTKAM